MGGFLQKPGDTRERMAAMPARSPLFFDSWQPRRTSPVMFVAGMLAAGGLGLLALAAIFTVKDFSDTFPFGVMVASLDMPSMCAVGAWMIILCALLIALDTALCHFTTPWGFMIETDLIEALRACGVLPGDLRKDCFGWRVSIRRRKRIAVIRFWIRYPSRSYEDMLPMVEGIGSAFRHAKSVVPDRANTPFTMALVLRYGDQHEW